MVRESAFSAATVNHNLRAGLARRLRSSQESRRDRPSGSAGCSAVRSNRRACPQGDISSGSAAFARRHDSEPTIVPVVHPVIEPRNRALQAHCIPDFEGPDKSLVLGHGHCPLANIEQLDKVAVRDAPAPAHADAASPTNTTSKRERMATSTNSPRRSGSGAARSAVGWSGVLDGLFFLAGHVAT